MVLCHSSERKGLIIAVTDLMSQEKRFFEVIGSPFYRPHPGNHLPMKSTFFSLTQVESWTMAHCVSLRELIWLL